MPVPVGSVELPDDYIDLLKQVKQRVKTERLKAVLSANTAQILMYWDIGHDILRKQDQAGWGTKVVDRLACDLKDAFPEMNGFSARNLKYMRKFAEEWPDRAIVQRTVAQIPWRSNLTLLEKIKDSKLRLWYAEQTITNGWSKNILAVQIETKLHKRTGQTANNFQATLPPDDSDMANQIFKDPYLFDFLGTAEVRKEAELENKLIEHLEKFLLELGQGFAFVGRQVHMEVGGDDFYIDLLFYHLKLRCYVVVELKAGKFCPGHVSQLTMYMNIVDDLLRHPDDKPTIGLLLVKEKNHTVAKYALTGNTKPIGVAEWEQHITESLPEDLQPSLPSIEEIEKELDRETEGGEGDDQV
ncbi:PDDEXK nuclease domain-containing protein [Chrysiogenes arsenatis]|uniref:PDDEXK nuclease domain-containing protein n=1 Tax=Chrysiogenes arsenatis TaxID=309797 RepID=UPI00068742F9